MSHTERQKESTPSYVKYSSLVFQLIAAIFLGYFLGKYLDSKFNNTNTPYYTVGCMLIFLGLYLYKLIKDITK